MSLTSATAGRRARERKNSSSKSQRMLCIITNTNAASIRPTSTSQSDTAAVDIQNVLNLFSSFNRDLQDFCESCAGSYASVGRVARTASPRRVQSLSNFVNKPVSDFPSARDYVFFALLSIIIAYAHSDIFHPFHPAISEAENLIKKNEYERLTKSGMYIYHIRNNA